jgi:hypothetical protein
LRLLKRRGGFVGLHRGRREAERRDRLVEFLRLHGVLTPGERGIVLRLELDVLGFKLLVACLLLNELRFELLLFGVPLLFGVGAGLFDESTGNQLLDLRRRLQPAGVLERSGRLA